MKIMLIRVSPSVKESEKGNPHPRLDVGFRQHDMRSLVYSVARRKRDGTIVDSKRRGWKKHRFMVESTGPRGGG